MIRNKTAFLFDLDGTLIDSVYQHVLAWKSSLDQEGIPLSVWRIHRKIGMSGGLFANQLVRETGLTIRSGCSGCVCATPKRISPSRPAFSRCPVRANCSTI